MTWYWICTNIRNIQEKTHKLRRRIIIDVQLEASHVQTNQDSRLTNPSSEYIYIIRTKHGFPCAGISINGGWYCWVILNNAKLADNFLWLVSSIRIIIPTFLIVWFSLASSTDDSTYSTCLPCGNQTFIDYWLQYSPTKTSSEFGDLPASRPLATFE